MDLSPRLRLSYVLPQQAQKHVTVNETFRRLDALVQLSVRSKGVSSEPATPVEGDAYILPSGKTGAAWSGFADQSIASFRDGAWVEIAAGDGFIAFVADEDSFYRFAGGSWGAFPGANAGNSTILGVNTTADAINRLAVKSDASLFNHDDVTPGTGDHRLKINKSAASKTASVIFQAGASGRAEIGLAGDDDFHVKVSPDNFSTSYEAFVIDKDSGYVGFGESAPATQISFSIGKDIKIFQSAGTAHQAGNVGSLALGILDGGGQCGVFIHNTHNGAYSSQDIRFVTAEGGVSSATERMRIYETGGVVVGAPTGGDKGAGTINAQAVYDDNTLLSCYVFDAALDGGVDLAKWDSKVPDRVALPTIAHKGRVTAPDKMEKRRHEPLRNFVARIGGEYDPLTLDGYARHWREKRHLTAMPNEASFDPVNGQLTTGEWIQRLVETVEIQAVLIEQLNQRVKTLEAA